MDLGIHAAQRRGLSVARNIFVEELIHTPIEQQGTEIVERKGIGHPDSIADGLAEAVSRALCKMYVARFGRILHHNTDQVEVVGGQSSPKFGGGVFLEPAYILLVGRATTVVNGERLPYRTTAIEAAHDYLTQTCTNLNVDADVTLDCKIGQGSVDLRGLYDTQKQLANDTSFGVGFAPFSELETVVLQTEQLINGPLQGDLKAVGQDIKVMGVRHGDAMRLTIAAAIVDKHVSDGDAYVGVIEELRERVLDNAVKYTDREVKVDINTGDNPEAGIYDIAERLVKEHPGKVKEVWVRIVSQIGKPIDEPQAATAQIIPEKGTKIGSLQKDAESLIDEELSKIYKLTDRIVAGKARCF